MKALCTQIPRHNSQNLKGYGFILSLMLLAILLTSASCKKEQPDPPPVLPPLTHVGAMTFGCYVNGEPWVAEVPPFIPTERHLVASFHKNTNLFILNATRVSNDLPREEINIRLNDFDVNKLEYLNNANQPYSNYNFRCNSGEANTYFKILDHDIDEVIVDYFSLEKRILSCTFSMKVNAVKCPDEQIEISDGRFDVYFSIIE